LNEIIYEKYDTNSHEFFGSYATLKSIIIIGGVSMKKKLFITFMMGLLVIGLAGCGHKQSTSKLFGTWKAEDGAGTRSTIKFTKKIVTVNDTKYSYKRTEVGYKNSVRYISIEQDNKDYTIVFPKKNDKNLALMLKPDDADEPLNGSMLYALNKTKEPNYQQYAQKYLH
jgi:hypothetical protein